MRNPGRNDRFQREARPGAPNSAGSAVRRRPLLVVSAGVLWLPWVIVTTGVIVTYARLLPDVLYHVSGSGFTGGLSRALVLVNFPIALVALPVIGLAVDRLRESVLAVAVAIGATIRCLLVFVPGVVDQGDLDWRLVNLLPAIGVGLAVVLGVVSGLFHDRVPVYRAALAGVVIALVLSLPWLAADWGFHLDGVPVFGWPFLSGTMVDGHAAVHLGHHHGMDGTLLFLTALPLIPLSRQVSGAVLRLAIQCYAGLQIAYGLANAIQDEWGEQVWKRGWVDTQIPSLLRPEPDPSWFVILTAAAVFSFLIVRSNAD